MRVLNLASPWLVEVSALQLCNYETVLHGTLQHVVTGPTALSDSVSPIDRFTPTASTIWNITFDQAVSNNTLILL